MTATSLSAYARKLADSGSKILFVDGHGSDTLGDGLSWGTAYRQITKALTVLGSAPGTIYVAGGSIYQPFTMSVQGQNVIGNGVLHYEGGVTQVTATGAATDCITVTADNCSLSGIYCTGYQHGTGWTGNGLKITRGQRTLVRNMRFQNDDDTAINGAGTSGGTGMYLLDCEGSHFEDIWIQEHMRAIDFGTEAATCTLVNMRGAANWYDLRLGGNSGGNLFIGGKFTVTKGATGNVVEVGPVGFGGGGNTFIGWDFDEGWFPNACEITGNENTFIRCVGAPQTILTVSGSRNRFIHCWVQYQWNVTGSNNTFVQPRVNGTLTFNGTNNVCDDEFLIGGTVTFTENVVRSGRYKEGSKTWDPASVADGAMTSTTVTVTGAALGDPATASFSVAVPAGCTLTANVTATDTVTVTLFNKSGGAVDLASGTLKARVAK